MIFIALICAASILAFVNVLLLITDILEKRRQKKIDKGTLTREEWREL